MKDSRLVPAARREFRAAVIYYRSKNPEAGVRFVEAVRAGIRFAKTNPGTPPIEHGYHKLVLSGPFPYTLWYRDEGNVIVVAAVWAQARNPEVLRQRLLKR